MMTTEATRAEALELLRQGHDLVKAALETVPPEAIDFKPGPARWTVREVVVHLADSEASSFMRLRKLIAENGSSVLSYDQDAWAQELHYTEMDMDEALALFKLLRHANWKLVSETSEIVWATHSVNHPDTGSYTLDDWLRIYSQHVPGHIKQIENNVSAWRESQ